MSSGPTLSKLEREIEVSRARLADNLTTLTSSRANQSFLDEVKREATDLKDVAVERAKSQIQESAGRYLETWKARAAENPAAVLAIAAGVAWRLFRKPPIATALVGVGVFSLLRSPAPMPWPGEHTDYLSEAKRRLKEQTTDLAHAIKDEALSTGNVIAESVGGLASAGENQLKEWGEKAQEAIHRTSDSLETRVHEIRESTPPWENERESASPADREALDTLLLGAAGAAVAAALAFSFNRRVSEEL
jgi:hypothetical protein